MADKRQEEEKAPAEVIRGVALICAAIVGATQGGGGEMTLDRALRFERYIREGRVK